jgi:hypothetical protein
LAESYPGKFPSILSLAAWNGNAEGCPFPDTAPGGYLTTHFFDDTITNGQTQTGPFPYRFGRKKGIEDPGKVRLRDSRPVVRNLENDKIFFHPCSQCKIATLLFHGIQGVIDEIE